MKILVGILAIALVAVGALAIRMSRQIDVDRQQITELQSQLQQAQTAQQNAEAALARQAELVANRPVPIVAPAAPTAATPAPAPPAPTATAAADDLIKRMTDPEGVDVRRAQRRMLLPQMYPDVGQWLNLSRDEENKLLDLIAKQETDQSTILLDPANRNNPAAQQEASRKAQALKQANEADLAALLGSKYPQFQEYQQTLPVHRQVSQLQAMIGTGPDGLSDAQYRSFTTALVAEQKRINQERSNLPPPTAGLSLAESLQQAQQRTAENNRRMLQVAASQLNSQQLASFRTLVEQQEKTSSALTRSLRDAEAAAAAKRPANGQ